MKRALRFFVLAFLVAGILRACVVEPMQVHDDVMNPVLKKGDVVLVNKLSYGIRVPGSGDYLWQWSNPEQGDLTVVADVGDPPMIVARTVVAAGGGGVTLVNGQGHTVKKDEFWIGKFEPGEKVSHDFGPLNMNNMVGKAAFLWFPKDSQVESGWKRFVRPIP